MANKFQPIDFQDLDDLYAYLPDDQLQMVKVLRDLVYECIPEVKEKLSYNVPFFRGKKPFAISGQEQFRGVLFQKV